MTLRLVEDIDESWEFPYSTIEHKDCGIIIDIPLYYAQTIPIVDDTEIDASGSDKYWDIAMDGSVINTRKNLETNWNDKDDEVILQHSTDSGLPDGAIYVRNQIIKPIVIEKESDLL